MADNKVESVHNDGEDDNPMTLDDFIEEESKLVKDAMAVLGSSDDKNCTYNLGYVRRQALYACMTCTPQNLPDAKPAGVCLACSYHCHEGHDLIELYTKRLFCCDCGNSKFGEKKCNLEPNKSSENEKNSYSQNFKGVYCTCGRPYPDPEDDTPDEMIQCIICEDWYHTRHLHPGLVDGSLSSNYAEMICGACSSRLPFLKYYTGLAASPISRNESHENSGTDLNVDKVISENGDGGVRPDTTSDGADTNAVSERVTIETENLSDSVGNGQNELKKNSMVNGATLETAETSKESCLLKKMKPLTDNTKENEATFWPGNFRSLLCSCDTCKVMYTNLGVPWILEESDTVQAYEEEGLQKAEAGGTAQAEGLLNSELAKFNRYQQVELIQNYNDFKSNLSEFLGKFAQQKKVVRKQDIDEFFQDMQAKKRQKIGTPPYNCH